jgi:hypothetical protein
MLSRRLSRPQTLSRMPMPINPSCMSLSIPPHLLTIRPSTTE